VTRLRAEVSSEQGSKQGVGNLPFVFSNVVVRTGEGGKKWGWGVRGLQGVLAGTGPCACAFDQEAKTGHARSSLKYGSLGEGFLPVFRGARGRTSLKGQDGPGGKRM